MHHVIDVEDIFAAAGCVILAFGFVGAVFWFLTTCEDD